VIWIKIRFVIGIGNENRILPHIRKQ